MNRIKKMNRWSVVGIGLALLLGIGGQQVLSAAQSQGFLSFGGIAISGVSCDDDCLNQFGTGMISQGDWYNYSHCFNDGDNITCFYIWEFA